MKIIRKGKKACAWWIGKQWTCEVCEQVFEMEEADREAAGVAILKDEVLVQCSNCKEVIALNSDSHVAKKRSTAW